MSPLDGGRVAQAFSKRAWILGGVLLGGMFLFTRAPQLLLIGGFALFRIFRGQDAAQVPATPEEQRHWMVRYFGLCFFLGAAIFLSKQLLGHADIALHGQFELARFGIRGRQRVQETRNGVTRERTGPDGVRHRLIPVAEFVSWTGRAKPGQCVESRRIVRLQLECRRVVGQHGFVRTHRVADRATQGARRGNADRAPAAQER